MRYHSEVGTGEHQLPAKKDVARGLLLRGSVYIHLDPRVARVVVPRWLSKQPQLVLQIGLDMAIPILDLRVDDEGISGTLSFSRSPFTCTIPWEAVFGLADDQGRGMVWPESLPRELRRATLRRVDDPRDELRDDEEAPTVSTETSALSPSEIPAEMVAGDVPVDGTVDADGAAPRRRLPPYLRVVK